jgi:hypothetical protein
MQALPKTPHHLAIWLHQNLVDVQPVDDGAWQGVLPDQYDFDLIVKVIDEVSAGLSGIHNKSTRTLEFHSASECVYKNLNELISKNQDRAPDLFTVLDIGYTHNESPAQESITNYISAVDFFQSLRKLSDHTSAQNTTLHLINSHNSKIEIYLDYNPKDLKPLKDLHRFNADYINDSHHEDQKRAIIKIALLDLFKGKQKVSFSEIIKKYDEFVISVRSSYAMYLAEFSFEKIKAEVEKDNLNSTLKLNKTFSEIQNQLLALPVTLVLVSGQMQKADGLILKNLVIWLGSLVFSILMYMLISNQKESIKSIGEEIELRQEKINALPIDIKEKFELGFGKLATRRQSQNRLLKIVAFMLIASFFFSTIVLFWYSYNEAFRACLTHIKDFTQTIALFFSIAFEKASNFYQKISFFVTSLFWR